MAYTTIDKPTDYFNTITYTGSGTSTAYTVGFSPNFVWVKKRDTEATDHYLFNTISGTEEALYSNLTNAEETNANSVTSFDANGFTSGNSGGTNQSGHGYVAWNWKAGTSFTNDASATGIGTIDSTGSVNTDAGFSIISYTGTGSAGTVAHGLGAVPKMIIIKSRNTTSLWGVYHQAIGNTHGLFLNATNAATSLSAYWNNTSPTSSVFSLGGDADINKSSDPLIAYCFAEKQGYSKFGSYTGNGSSTDNSFIYTGFKIGWLMIKKTSGTSNWTIWDSVRQSNEINKPLWGDLSNAETAQSTVKLDLLSNGFKIRGNGSNVGSSGGSYIYMCFAENPFVSSTGVPATAR